MGSSSKPHQTSLFQVYLRLRPPVSSQPDGQPPQAERHLVPEPPEQSDTAGSENNAPTHITLQPPNDSRKRAVERFGFTKVFEENASQLDVFQDTGMDSLIKGVLQEGRDGLVATLGVTGSGKSHTILGSKSQRGITQMALDILFRSLAPSVQNHDNSITPVELASLAASDPTEAQLFSAQAFLEAVYGDPSGDRGRNSRAQTPVSRAQTPMTVWNPPPQKIWKGIPIVRPSPLRQCHFKLHEEPENMGLWEVGAFPAPGCTNRLGSRNIPSERLVHDGPVPQAPSTRPNNAVESDFAKTWRQTIKEPTPALTFPRRHKAQRPSALPRSPDVGHIAFDVKTSSEYMILVSMYEVYNDRIFDLLSPSIVPGQVSTMSRQGNTQKDRRRPLLFKPTECSPDRKVVAGLRKIACATYEEALAVLDVGLTERKVAGTGSNSVSSRSHGFFSLEVKRKKKGKGPGEETWVGNALTVVDLAGSERARAAKTGGATLAEAGKINESLMYLGQCLQMQSSLQDGSKSTLVPFRQCKLTELLFSNSFLSSSQVSQNRRPQKALMIVTADPLGDFNATSQILRYSALAREVAVPRIPSVSDTILSSSSSSSRGQGSGRTSPNFVSNEELDRAMAEITRLSTDCHSLSVRLAEEEIVREELEMRLGSAEEKCLMTEQEVREECYAEMDERMEEERRRWQNAWDEQYGRNDEHIDKKIEVLSRGFQIYNDPEPSPDERTEQLELENDQLRSKVAALERELTGRSPTKKSKSRNALEPSRSSNILGRESDIEMALSRMDQLKLTDNMFPPQSGTTGKKPKAMTMRKWDLAPEEDI